MTEGAAELSGKLKADGHIITVITGRAHATETGTTGKLFRWMLKHWLKKNDFMYDEIYYCSEKDSAEGKMKICLEKGIDVLIDDKPNNLMVLKDKINVICYPAIWNEGVSDLDPYRVINMYEVYDRLKGLTLDE